MMQSLTMATILIAAVLAPPAHAADCEADARSAMLDVAHPVPMRQDVTTEMAGQTIRSAALSTPDRRGMSLDANGTPVSLWIGGRFYTSTDGGKSWSLLREQSAEELAAQDGNLKKQAEQARDIACVYDMEFDGKPVHRFSLSYDMIPSGIPVESTYWVDAKSRFPWKVIHTFGGSNPSTITQRNTPAPELDIADPSG